jgi:hypothetical protein
MMPFTRDEHDVTADVEHDAQVVAHNSSDGTPRHAPTVTLIGPDTDHYV